MKNQLGTPGIGLDGRTQHESRTSLSPSTLVDQTQTDYERLERGQDEETTGPAYQLPLVPSSTSSENKETVITNIRATDIAIGLRRLPAGFYIVVQHSGHSWKTENKRSWVNGDVVEWNGTIPIPPDLFAIIRLDIYASFEFEPMLGVGELLRELTVTVEQLLDHNVKDIPFTFPPIDGDILSPCSSILVTVERQKYESSDLSLMVHGSHWSTSESWDKLADITDHGHRALSCFRNHGDKWNLERSIEEFERALINCPLDHPCRAVIQSNLAMAMLIYCRVEDADASLDVPLHLYRNVLVARPVGHVDRPSTLIQLATLHLARFELGEDATETEQAKALLLEATQLSSPESHEHRVAVFMLRLRARRTVGVGQVVARDLSLTPTDRDPWVFGQELLEGFEQSGELADLQEAVAVPEELRRSTPNSDDRCPAGLGNLGLALQNRFSYLGEPNDLDDAISTLRDAVDLTPHGHPDKPTHLNNLGNALTDRFDRTGMLSDLEEAILRYRDGIELMPHNHPDKPGYLSNLGASFLSRFERLGELTDIDDAVSRHMDAVEFTPPGHHDKPSHLNSLGNSFLTRFESLGKLGDLEDAILRHGTAVDFTPHGHPDRPTHVSSLANSLFIQFMRFGELNDLERAIAGHREAVELTHLGHPHKAGHLSNLGNALKARFERLGDPSDLEDAVSMLKDVVDLTPHDQPNKPGRLQSLGNCLKARFDRYGNLGDLEAAISMLNDAVDLTPRRHPEKSICLNNLGNSILVRFERLGVLSDLHNAVSRHREAVDLTPRGHPHKPAHLASLGNSLKASFERLGEPGDLEEAISTFRDALELAPNDHPQKPALFYNLGNSFFSRFQQFKEQSDVEKAILSLRSAVVLVPPGHPDKPAYLRNFGNSFLARFNHIGQLCDLEDAISRHRDAIDLIPNGHPDTHSYINNLGNSFSARFNRFKQLSDLEDAISRYRDTVDLIPPGHPYIAGYLSNLGASFKVRFDRIGELHDLQHAISAFSNAIDFTPHGHPDQPRRLCNLANSLRARFERLEEPNDLKQAICLYSLAAVAPNGPIGVQFHASQGWIRCARCISHHSLLHAYSIAISLVPQVAWIGLSLAQRYYALMKVTDVVREAAAAALDSGLPEIAAEWLEQGRLIVWEELLQLRSSYEELSLAYPDHARRLRDLSTTLERAGAAREDPSSALMEHTPGVAHPEFFEWGPDKHRTLSIERDKLLREIRSFPGFEQFLLHKAFSQLRDSARSGPVVILNAADSRCDALVVLADVDHVIHVPLPNFNFRRSMGFQNMLGKLLGHARTHDDRKGDPTKRLGISWGSLLSTLWKDVVKPVLDALAFTAPGDLSRMFWCPTGPFVFLPIHAAGLYDAQHSQPGHKLSDFVISSYIPSLSILVPSPNLAVVPSSDLRLLVVRQPPSDGLPRLPGAETELKHIRAVVRNSPSAHTTLVESSVGTVKEVLDLMKDADWVHFACHGIQDVSDPTNSGLCLADRRRLKISDIIALSRPHGGLAFLSACQTAMGDYRLSDEAIHVAAGMLFAGYKGVVGTMWSISDRLAPDVARDVYIRLFQNEARPDHQEAARALHEAIGRLRDSGASFVQWVPFIHVGL